MPGAVFRWRTAGPDIPSTVAQVDAPHRIVSGGSANGITSVHVWTFTGVETGRGPGTLVSTEESWDNEPVRAAPDALQSALDACLRAWLRALKSTTEARAAPPH